MAPIQVHQKSIRYTDIQLDRQPGLKTMAMITTRQLQAHSSLRRTVPKLSVIIPCFNCEKTLEQAVASVYRQEPLVPVDVTMVDDGSTDGTYEVMTSLATTYPKIKLIRHASNQGGGAARNTAVANSDGQLIFCLDSDDILGPDFLRNMTEYWLKKRCDGLAMSTSIKFNNTDIHDVAYVDQFEIPGGRVRFESLLSESACALYVNFLITRNAFVRIGGYPTSHGFDTQGIAFRFLSEGLVAYICPNTTYYHRVNYRESYYLREQRAGRINWNWLNIFDEHLYLFKDEIKATMLASNLFATPDNPRPTDMLLLMRGLGDLYVSNYRQLLRLGRAGVARRVGASEDRYDQYWMGVYRSIKGQYREALHHFGRALELGFDFRIIYYRILLASLRLCGSTMTVPENLAALSEYCQPLPLERWPWRKRLVRSAMGSRLLGGVTSVFASAVDWLRERRPGVQSSTGKRRRAHA
jgi:glycosyltransferase involved in cell wall biosynthesis